MTPEEIKELRELVKNTPEYDVHKNLWTYARKVPKLLDEVERLQKRQEWIDEVGRPAHPDDERPWCSSYLDAKAAIEDLTNKFDLANEEIRNAYNDNEAHRQRINSLEGKLKLLQEVAQAADALMERVFHHDGTLRETSFGTHELHRVNDTLKAAREGGAMEEV